MTKKKTDTEFQKEVLDLVGNEYVFLDPYIKSSVKIRVKHNKCSKVYKVSPNAFLRGNRCPYCAGLIRKNDAQFKQEVYDLVGDEYTFLESYANNHTKIQVRHNKCGSVYEVQPYAFLQGKRCPYCYGTPKKTDAQFKQEVFDLVGDEYAFLDSYIDNKTKIRVRHNKCGHVYEVRPRDFFSHHSRCPYCSGRMHKTNQQFQREVFDLAGNDYTFLDDYVNDDTKIRVKHNECGNIYEVQPTSFLQGHRCPYCNSPKGETIITKILNNLDIYFEYQKTFDELRDAQPLSYDFYIPEQSILIEYQGIQHYQPIDYFGGNATFKYQQKHDKMKADYAKDNGYNLIAVPYTENTFSKIKKYLLKHGLTK